MSARPSNKRTPLGRVRDHGSAKSGTEHFIRQRLTAIANIPLTIAAVLIVIALIGRNHAAVVQILGSTPVAIIMVLLSFLSSITRESACRRSLRIGCMRSAPSTRS